jgi:hypothetical protein
MNKRIILTLVVSLLAVMLYPIGLRPARADESSSLSPYWGPNITRWAELITHYAGQRGLDPDLVSALIYEESHGLPYLVSSMGAVGLMQVMSQETGFYWRPRRAELLNPSVNLAWGTRTFGLILQDAEGSASRALAAYNGGWEQETIPSTQKFAIRVLDHYARSIVARSGYEAESMKAWTLVLDIQSSAGIFRKDVIESGGTIELDSRFDLSKLPDSTPRAMAYSAIDEDGTAWLVEAWVIVEPIEGRTIQPGRGTY